MSQYKGRTTRHLGSVRHSQVLERSPSNTALSAKLDRTYGGISGSALSVPIKLKLSVKGRSESDINFNNESSCCKTIVATSSDLQNNSASNIQFKEGQSELNELMLNDKSDAEGKEKQLMKELHGLKENEKQLLKKIADMQILIDRQVLELKDKDKRIVEQQECFQNKISELAELLENEKKKHTTSQQELEQTKVSLFKETQRFESVKLQLDLQILEISNQLKMQFEEYSKKQRIQEADIILRDEKLERLKKQMAESLKGNSKERQQQLEELGKELENVRDEADILRKTLKSLQRSGKGNCNNCEQLIMDVKTLSNDVQEKDQLIRTLNSRLSAQQRHQRDSTR